MTEEDFAARLQRLRERKGINRSIASELCGLNKGAFRRYERRERLPNLNALIAMADFFGVSIDYLAGRENR